MNMHDFFDAVFAVRPSLAVVAAALFTVPVARVFTLPFRPSPHPIVVFFAVRSGRYERMTGWLRAWIGVPFLVSALLWHAYRWATSMRTDPWNDHAIVCLASFALVAVSVLFGRLKRRDLLDLVVLVQECDVIHPQEFMDRFHAAHGCARPNMALPLRMAFDPLATDFSISGKRGRRSRLAYLRAIGDIMVITRLIVLADTCRGTAYAREAASKLALVAAARGAQLARARIVVEGCDNLADVSMPLMYCLNHTSSFDFVILPLLLYAHGRAAHLDIPMAPCFLLARDHFLDNPLFYRVIGIGRAAEIMGMVFVERRRASRTNAEGVVRASVEKLLEARMPLALYPQGSRARGRRGAGGARLDAGYYTVGNRRRLEREGGHLKKGAAFIAADAARGCARADRSCRISIVPAVFLGAATVLPRESHAVKFGATVTIRVGEPILITSSMVETFKDGDDAGYTAFVNSVHSRIDQALKATARVHADLERRFFEDIRGAIDAHNMEDLSLALKQWRNDDYLVYVMLDLIYACKPRQWRALLGRLAHLIINDAPREELVALRLEIARVLTT